MRMTATAAPATSHSGTVLWRAEAPRRGQRSRTGGMSSASIVHVPKYLCARHHAAQRLTEYA